MKKHFLSYVVVLAILFLQSVFYAQESKLNNEEHKNRLLINYNLDSFDSGNKPWHLSSLEYERKFSFGSVIPRVNYARRFNDNGFQFETDSYIFISKKIYTYLNAGFSEDIIFPKLRFGIEPYLVLPEGFEASVGFRFLSFEQNDIRIYTGSIGKYFGNYWVSIRPFLVPESGETKFTLNILARRYFTDKYSYLTLRLAWGSYPSQSLTLQEFARTNSKSIGFDYSFWLLKDILLGLGLSYEQEEININLNRDRYTFILMLSGFF